MAACARGELTSPFSHESYASATASGATPKSIEWKNDAQLVSTDFGSERYRSSSPSRYEEEVPSRKRILEFSQGNRLGVFLLLVGARAVDAPLERIAALAGAEPGASARTATSPQL